ncbi:glr2365 [Gloeobacter violaceus PCC 7421]|uniref:Glr2365 protein n=2 Tax=Gloeobacter violaceus TaxID=33072 RepID=Q7NI19_GLOVI|nr:glr2365 [Gloeobacter violaceus PCC 7421]
METAMSDAFSAQISERICRHMNEDHGDAIALYARAFGGAGDCEAARMLSIDAQGMNLLVSDKDAQVPVRVTFERPLKDAEDAHQTLIGMVKTARARLSGQPS